MKDAINYSIKLMPLMLLALVRPRRFTFQAKLDIHHQHGILHDDHKGIVAHYNNFLEISFASPRARNFCSIIPAQGRRLTSTSILQHATINLLGCSYARFYAQQCCELQRRTVQDSCSIQCPASSKFIQARMGIGIEGLNAAQL